ncbi:hypothetical protein [Microcystis aeruginosa]|uniref:hypothetical protein n=1 Tax=Microcystis aeruginosa TaxID=1126 RepID=UPI001562B81D|nr:hypothetical protein [Microcystis aeruginosa]
MEVKLPSYGLFLSYQSGDILKAKVSFLFACMAEYAFSGEWQVGIMNYELRSGGVGKWGSGVWSVGTINKNNVLNPDS